MDIEKGSALARYLGVGPLALTLADIADIHTLCNALPHWEGKPSVPPWSSSLQCVGVRGGDDAAVPEQCREMELGTFYALASGFVVFMPAKDWVVHHPCFAGVLERHSRQGIDTWSTRVFMRPDALECMVLMCDLEKELTRPDVWTRAKWAQRNHYGGWLHWDLHRDMGGLIGFSKTRWETMLRWLDYWLPQEG